MKLDQADGGDRDVPVSAELRWVFAKVGVFCLRATGIRQHLGRAGGVDDALYRRCAQALRARDVLAEREVRALALEQVRTHVEALGQLTRLARRAREGTD